jgi:hypothetical protein
VLGCFQGIDDVFEQICDVVGLILDALLIVGLAWRENVIGNHAFID